MVEAPVNGHDLLVDPTTVEDQIMAVSFSPDGARLILTVSADGTVRMWDAASGEAVGGPIPTGGTVDPSIALSTDGDRALVPGDRGLLELILNEGEWVAVACSIAGRELTEDERAEHGLVGSANACGGPG